MADSGRLVPDGYILASPQAYARDRGVDPASESARVDLFREGPDIADERDAENEAALRVAAGEPVEYPEALVTPHGRR